MLVKAGYLPFAWDEEIEENMEFVSDNLFTYLDKLLEEDDEEEDSFI